MITVSELKEWLSKLPDDTPLGIKEMPTLGEISLMLYAAGPQGIGIEDFYLDVITLD